MTFRHRLFIGGSLLFVIVGILLISTRGFSYPSPQDSRRSVAEIGARAAAEREAATTVFSLLCLDALSKGNPRKAIKSCSLALLRDPKDVSTLKLRGNAYFLAGDPGKAAADFSRAIALSPLEPDSYRFRATVYMALHRDREALADYDHALTLAPGDPISREFRGYFYQSRARYDLALADFSAVVAMRPNLARAWNSLCWTRFLAKASPQEALLDCNRAAQLDPSAPNTYDSRGYVYLRLARFVLAMKDFDRALALKPNLASSLFGRGVAKLRLGNPTASRDIAAAKLLEPAIEARFYGYGIKLSGPSGT